MSLMRGESHIIGPPPPPGLQAPLAPPPDLNDPIERIIHEARQKLLRGEGVELTAPGVDIEALQEQVDPDFSSIATKKVL